MKQKQRKAALSLAVAMGAALTASSAMAQAIDSKRIEANNPTDWLT